MLLTLQTYSLSCTVGTEMGRYFAEQTQSTVQFINEINAGNIPAAEEARINRFVNVNTSIPYWVQLNPYWDGAKFQQHFYKLLNLTSNEIIQIFGGKYDESVSQYDAIRNLALQIADDTAYGVVKQLWIPEHVTQG